MEALTFEQDCVVLVCLSADLHVTLLIWQGDVLDRLCKVLISMCSRYLCKLLLCSVKCQICLLPCMCMQKGLGAGRHHVQVPYFPFLNFEDLLF